MKISIDRNSTVSIAKQIYLEIENRIRTGIFKSEAKLPSIRSVSKATNVSPMTVVKAYELLTKEGLIYKIHGKGTFVKDIRLPSKIDKSINEKIDTTNTDLLWQDEVQDYVKRTGYVQRTMQRGKDTGVNLLTAALHHRFLPTETIIKKFNDSLNKNYSKLGLYPPVEGDPGLIRGVRLYLENKSVEADIDEILITNGSQLAINLTAQTFIGYGDVVVVEAPTFPGAIDVFKSRGAVVLEVPIDETGIKIDALLMICEKYPVKMVYTMPSFQNPTGYTMSLDVMQDILELSNEHNFIILEDDSWGDLSYERIARPLKSLDRNGRVIYIGGFSKIFGPAYRLSALVASGSLRSKLIAAKSSLDSGASLINQYMIEPYINSLEQKQHLTWLRHELKNLRDRVIAHLKSIMPSYIKLVVPKGGLVLWLSFPQKFDCKLLYYKAITEENISFLLGDNCYSSIRGSNQLRICFTYVEEGLLIDSITRLIRMIKEVHGQCIDSLQMPMI
ncbi:PLP-dependent aminotransferase family protein [Wukongibacter sp. M2B1]|uniref:aminotransferase-like domain-containing protein n=1 Tax=Wukongibacter sp. M2B1 TaxID=3088895 RepID=UPI003D7BAB47